jgi:hypothetical protein
VTQPKQKPSPPKTSTSGRKSFANRTEKVLIAVLDPIDVIGDKVMGDLWRTFYLSVQDAISLACLIQIPSLIGKFIIGKEYNSFKVCLSEDALGSNRYACFVIVAADFGLWAVLAGRMLIRFIQDFMDLSKKQGGANGKQP